MKKVLSVILTLLIVMSFAVVPANAEEQPTVTVSSAEAVVGNSVTLKVSLANNPGLSSIRVAVSYNEDDRNLQLTGKKNVALTKATSTSASNGIFYSCANANTSETTNKEYAVEWIANKETVPLTADGELLELTFKVLSAPSGTSEIPVKVSVEAYDTTDVKKLVTFKEVDGSIKLPSELYTLTINDNIGGEPKTEQHKAGETVSISAKEGYQFKNWTSSLTSVDFVDAKATKTSFVMPAGSFTVTANYDVPTVTYNVKVTNGTLKDGTTSGSFAPGAAVRVTADDPVFGKQFKCWTGSSGIIFDDAESSTATFTMVSSNVTVTAEYEDIPVTIHKLTLNRGSINGISEREFYAGTKITIIADDPQSGEVFKNWTGTYGSSKKAVAFDDASKVTTTFVMPNADTVVTAVYGAPDTTKKHTVTVSNGTFVLNSKSVSKGSVSEGSTITLTAAAAASGKKFSYWTTNNGGTFSSIYAANPTFMVPAGDVTVTAHYVALDQYTLLFNANGGTGAPSSITQNENTVVTIPTTKPTKTITITYKPCEGEVSPESKSLTCAFKSWNTAAAGTGTAYAAGAKYTLSSTCSLFAQYNPVAVGTLPTPTRDGYKFDGWYTQQYGGTKITDTTTFSSSASLYAHWIVRGVEYTITSTAGANGTISPAGKVIVDQGADQKFDISPVNGYEITNVKVDGKDIGPVFFYNFSDVQADHTITATYGTRDTSKYGTTIIITINEGGSVALNGSVNVHYGDSRKLTITPERGYKVKDVTINKESVGAVSGYSFDNISSVKWVNIEFEETEVYYYIDVSSTGAGTVSPSGQTKLSAGETRTITVTPNTGYKVLSVTVDGTAVAISTSYTFKNIAKDHTVKVVFEEEKAHVTNVTRLAGANRISTALEISSKGWTSSGRVIIANGYDYPDALAGATLSKKLNAPILLVDTNSIKAETITEIKRLGANEAIILGGTNAVSTAVENSVKSAGLTVTRVAGQNRNGTASAIASKLTSSCNTVFLVNNTNYADALSISPVAAIYGYPILYVNKNGSIPTETQTALSQLGCKNVYIIGGYSAVSSSAEIALNKMSITAQRIYGADRYATSISVYNQFKTLFSNDVAIATGNNFPDALAGGCFAASKSAPVLLVNNTATDELKSIIKPADNLYVFGGTDVISSTLPDELIK